MSTWVDSVLVIDTVLWIVGVVLAIVVLVAQRPWVLPVGIIGIVVVMAVLVIHRHRRRAEYARWRAERAARRQRRVLPGA